MDHFKGVRPVDYSMSTTAKIDVVFRNHRDRLIEEIRRSPVVLGCVAWMTDEAILHALASCEHVNIIVQKEDFLRPDAGKWSRRLRQMYADLPAPRSYVSLPGIADDLRGSDPRIAPRIDPVRCVGNHNRERRPSWPRMHNKFLVFCDLGSGSVEETNSGGLEVTEPALTPRRVWTGSYNLSLAAKTSWENAVLIENDEVADAYASEFAQITAFSEPLNWENDWVAPEYRIRG